MLVVGLALMFFLGGCEEIPGRVVKKRLIEGRSFFSGSLLVKNENCWEVTVKTEKNGSTSLCISESLYHTVNIKENVLVMVDNMGVVKGLRKE